MKDIRIYQKSIMRKIIRRNDFERKRNEVRNRRKKTEKTEFEDYHNPYTSAKLPNDFRIENIEEVLAFLNKTSRRCSPTYIRHIFFYMQEIQKIDIYAICLLLSLVNRLSKRISCAGSYPLDLNVRNIFIDSGFLSLTKTNLRRKHEAKYPNMMYVIGSDSVDGKRIGMSIKETMKRVVGIECHFAPVYEIMIEISSNSVEHSNDVDSEKNWLVSISYEKDKAHFLMTDTGSGILKTLSKKKLEIFKDVVSFKNNAKVLVGVFNKEYQSCTGEINRHKGLPMVMETFKLGYISDLKVLTNNVFYDFEKDNSIILTNEFHGTMFSWTISNNNFQLWQKQNCCA